MASSQFQGQGAFRLYETFGLPLDFMDDAARDAGIGFDKQVLTLPWKSSASSRRLPGKAAESHCQPCYQALPQTKFEGYRQTRSDNCEVLAIIKSKTAPASARRN